MKKNLLFLFLALLTLAGCRKSSPALDGNSKIPIRPAKGVALRSADNPEHLSAIEIVKQTVNLKMMTYRIGAEDHGYINKEFVVSGMGFAPEQRDYNPEDPKLLMYAFYVIDDQYNNRLRREFLDAEDVVLERILDEHTPQERLDTIAYIPNKLLRKAAEDITNAYNRGDFDTVYKLFNDVYRFIPITGKEWRELKAKGEQ